MTPAMQTLFRQRLKRRELPVVSYVSTPKLISSPHSRMMADLILADYTLPSFDGLTALEIARKTRPDIPFIFVSGTLDEEVAIEALKIGATDYVFKTRLSRIVPSAHRALREARDNTDRTRADEPLPLTLYEIRNITA